MLSFYFYLIFPRVQSIMSKKWLILPHSTLSPMSFALPFIMSWDTYLKKKDNGSIINDANQAIISVLPKSNNLTPGNVFSSLMLKHVHKYVPII